MANHSEFELNIDDNDRTPFPVGSWPDIEGKPITILLWEQTGTHTFDYSENGLLSIFFNDDLASDSGAPESARTLNSHRGYVCLNAEGIEALRRLLAQIGIMNVR